MKYLGYLIDVKFFGILMLSSFLIVAKLTEMCVIFKQNSKTNSQNEKKSWIHVFEAFKN